MSKRNKDMARDRAKELAGSRAGEMAPNDIGYSNSLERLERTRSSSMFALLVAAILLAALAGLVWSGPASPPGGGTTPPAPQDDAARPAGTPDNSGPSSAGGQVEAAARDAVPRPPRRSVILPLDLDGPISGGTASAGIFLPDGAPVSDDGEVPGGGAVSDGDSSEDAGWDVRVFDVSDTFETSGAADTDADETSGAADTDTDETSGADIGAGTDAGSDNSVSDDSASDDSDKSASDDSVSDESASGESASDESASGESASGNPAVSGGPGDESLVWPEGLSPVTWKCLRDTSDRFEVPLSLLLLVMDAESGTVGETSGNTNGSYDMGPMQINSLWLPVLAGLGIGERQVVDHGCLNLAVGAWILRGHLRRTGSFEQAAADYHSRSKRLGGKYLAALRSKARDLDVRRTLRRANRGFPDMAAGVLTVGEARPAASGAWSVRPPVAGAAGAATENPGPPVVHGYMTASSVSTSGISATSASGRGD
ncbi:MAG: lytic transglycosylase domain-containing protein [Deltaproteobacteria bacterium]|jgi:hypothetical protein|nr:lytic transglycosylase domain-containing protein [Deltaproteobacteria bacterium]